MTKEEVAEVVAYREEIQVSYKQRLAELGINAWNFLRRQRIFTDNILSDSELNDSIILKISI